jgi:hypothetical protein
MQTSPSPDTPRYLKLLYALNTEKLSHEGTTVTVCGWWIWKEVEVIVAHFKASLLFQNFPGKTEKNYGPPDWDSNLESPEHEAGVRVIQLQR